MVYLSLGDYLPTGMAHEIGHALSLSHSGQGGIEGPGLLFGENFGWSNIMFNGMVASQTVGRDYLTLGQVYRLNIDVGSWLNTPSGGTADVGAGRPAKTCQPDVFSPAAKCPAGKQPWP